MMMGWMAWDTVDTMMITVRIMGMIKGDGLGMVDMGVLNTEFNIFIFVLRPLHFRFLPE